MKLSKKIRRSSKKMGQKSKILRQKLLEFFFKHPNVKLTVRQLASKTRMSRSTTQYQLSILKDEGFLSADNIWLDSWQNRLRKTNYYVEKIAQSGLVDYLEETFAASAIVLFGSFRKGESVKESDIDIFVECAKEKKVDLSRYEKQFEHKIQLFTRSKVTQLPKNLLNNVVNGIKLKGYFTIK